MRAAPVRQRQASLVTGADAAPAASGLFASGPGIRPRAAQLLADVGDPAAGVATVQRIKNPLAAQIVKAMKGKTHKPHGGSKNANQNAQKKGYGNNKTKRKLIAQAENAQKNK
jgi:hypothetical protein